MNAATGRVQMPNGAKPVTICRAAAAMAPDDTPTIPGSDNGLAKAPCMTAPAVASDAPTSTPRTMRGKRTYQMSSSATGSLGDPPMRLVRRRIVRTTSEGDTS